MVFNFCQDLFWKKKNKKFHLLAEKGDYSHANDKSEPLTNQHAGLKAAPNQTTELNEAWEYDYSLKENTPSYVHTHTYQ